MSFRKAKTSPLAAGKYRTRHGSTDTGPGSLAAEHKRLEHYRAAAIEDMAHKAVRLDLEKFRDSFFPLPAGVAHEDRQRPEGNIFHELADLEEVKDMLEAEVSQKFISALKNANIVNASLELAESQHAPDKGDYAAWKFDAGFFRPDCVPTDGRPHWADQMVPIEFKSHDTQNDPYDDREKKGLDADAIERKKVRGQLINYGEHIFRHQHRIALYMVIIIGRLFRFMRWDRSGTIVTPAIDYVDHPDLLCEMLWRMSLLDDEQLGLDPSAVRIRPKDEDYKRMDEAAKPRESDLDRTNRVLGEDEEIPDDFVFRYVRDDFRASLGPEWPRYCLDVPDGDTVKKFLVGKPSFSACGMAGRGTRGYVALDRQTGRFVWLKDAWRAHYELVDQEGTVLHQLNEAGVEYVPTLVCHGDILNQTTRTPEFWEAVNSPPETSPTPPAPPSGRLKGASSRTLKDPPPRSSKSLKRSISEVEDSDATLPNGEPREDCPLRRHKHYWIVVEEVCIPLVEINGGKQLLGVVYNCVKAHRDATERAKIVHRDVSGGNVLIHPRLVKHSHTNARMITTFGILVDWELSKPITAQGVPSRARQPERTGTWQYMSVATLNDHSKVVETSDELESFLHIILYYGVRYLTSNCPDAGNFIERFFDSYCLVDGRYMSGAVKKTALYSGQVQLDSDTSEELLQFDSPLDGLIEDLLKVFKAHYAVVKYEAKQEKLKKAIKPLVPAQRPAPSKPVARFDYDVLDFDSSDEPIKPRARKTSKGSKNRKPTERQRRLARQAQTHQWMLGELRTAIRDDGWASVGDDRVKSADGQAKGDNVPVNFVPKNTVCAVAVRATGSAKKPRTGPSASAPLLGASSDTSSS